MWIRERLQSEGHFAPVSGTERERERERLFEAGQEIGLGKRTTWTAGSNGGKDRLVFVRVVPLPAPVVVREGKIAFSTDSPSSSIPSANTRQMQRRLARYSIACLHSFPWIQGRPAYLIHRWIHISGSFLLFPDEILCVFPPLVLFLLILLLAADVSVFSPAVRPVKLRPRLLQSGIQNHTYIPSSCFFDRWFFMPGSLSVCVRESQ